VGTGAFTICAQLTYTGCIDTICKPSYYVKSRPTASFNVSDTVGCIPLVVGFTNTSTFSYAPMRSYYWNFGDSVRIDSSTIAPSHTYDSSNIYIASLTVVDTNGCRSTTTRQLIANQVKAGFIMSDSSTCTANPDTLNPITFTSTSTGFVGHYQWILPAGLGPTNPLPEILPDLVRDLPSRAVAACVWWLLIGMDYAMIQYAGLYMS
jgi:PKD repeat protein